MSDSLRDQLMQAGFAAPKAEAKRKKKSAKSPPRKPGEAGSRTRPAQAASSGNSRRTQQPGNLQTEDAILQRKALKVQIKTLIESTAAKDFAGEIAYRFTVKNRIRELYVKEAIRAQLVAGTLIITRLNGTTQLVPADTASQIRELNPEWAIFGSGNDATEANKTKPDIISGAQTDTLASTPETDPEDDDYADYQVPDDLVW